MKLSLLFSVLFFLITNFCFSQIEQSSQATNHISHNKKTLKISTKDLTETTISDLKDELAAWNEKNISVTILEKTNKFS